MDLELRLGITQGGQCGDDAELSGFEIKTRSRVNVAKRKLDEVVGEIRCDVAEAFDHALTLLLVYFP
jgi:hypothetical protein